MIELRIEETPNGKDFMTQQTNHYYSTFNGVKGSKVKSYFDLSQLALKKTNLTKDGRHIKSY